jgi:opacity protein-like surface antigen
VNTLHRTFIWVAWISCAIVASAIAASAQSQVRVTVDRSTIWTADFQTPAAVVDGGTMLTVVAERKDWYEVIVPERADPARAAQHGFIFQSFVTQSTAKSTVAEPRAEIDPPRVGAAGFAHFGYSRFAAQNSFQAILGHPGGGIFGGGGEVRFGRGFFVNASIDRFEQTGQRAIVANGQVFNLGVSDTIALTTWAGTAGWRFAREHVTPYVGGGLGLVRYRETSNFADPGEDVDSRFRSYHVVGGVEVRDGWVATAFEVAYSRVPDAIGVGGASAAFHETDLGGIVGRIKVLVGR